MSILFMLSVCASGRLVGSANVPDYHIAVDQLTVMHSSNALMMLLLSLWGLRMLLLAAFKFFFDLVKSVEMMPFYDDINQHPRVCIWIEDQGGSSSILDGNLLGGEILVTFCWHLLMGFVIWTCLTFSCFLIFSCMKQ